MGFANRVVPPGSGARRGRGARRAARRLPAGLPPLGPALGLRRARQRRGDRTGTGVRSWPGGAHRGAARGGPVLGGRRPPRSARARARLRGRGLTPARPNTLGTVSVPTITYPDLPVSERRDDLAAAIRDHQVVVVAGETGSGKTTQLPKICLELGRGIRGTIGHTQPRRLAARTVAQRIADELGTPLGDAVGYTVRFTDQVERPHAGQADDRRHPARRDPARPAAAALRHADPRRGARAQPQHRLPARLPARAAAPPPRPQGDRHLGDDRAGALRRALRAGPAGRCRSSRCPGAPTRSRSATGRWSRTRRRRRGRRRRRRPRPRDRPPHRGARPDRGDPRRGARARPRGAGRRAGLPVRRAGDPRHRRRAARRPDLRDTRGAAAVRPAADRRAAAGVRPTGSDTRPPGRAGHQRRRDVADRARHPLRHRPGHRPHLALQPAHQGAAAADRADLAGLGRAAGRPLRAGRRRHLHPALLRARLRGPAARSPTRRSCAPTSPR